MKGQDMKPKKQAIPQTPATLDGFVFVDSGSKLGRLIGLNNSGTLYVTRQNAADSGLDKAAQVVVAFNDKTNEIALKPCEPEEYGSVTVSYSSDRSGARTISVAHVLKRFSKKSRLYSYRKEMGGRFIVLTPTESEH